MEFFVNPMPEYICQFASRELVTDYLDNDLGADADPNWTNFGFENKEEYEFWIMRLCGLVCTKMVLDAVSLKSRQESIAQLTRKGVELGGYKINDEDGNFVDIGWFYQPLIELAKEYDVDGRIFTNATPDDICMIIKEHNYPIVSVNPKVIRGDIDTCQKKGGHLVLVVGYKMGAEGCEGFYIHNPSGRENSTQEKAFIPIERFKESFAGRGFQLYQIERHN